MKQALKFIFLAYITTGLWACEKKTADVVYVGAVNPVLTASSTSAMVLTSGNAANTAVTFNWTNPNYQFNTGVSSQDVSYTLQVDTAGANFNSASKQEVSISKDLSKSFTVKDFNAIFSKMNVLENITHNIEFRVKASLANNSLPLYSNVIKMVITPYLDVVVPIPTTGELYITGNAMPSDWTNSPPASQKFTKISNTEYTITVALTAGKQYKFLSTLTQWQPQYGAVNANNNDAGDNIGYNLGSGSDPNSINTPSVAGNYKITVNFKTGTYTVVKQ